MPESKPQTNAEQNIVDSLKAKAPQTDPPAAGAAAVPAAGPIANSPADPIAKNRILTKMLERLFATLVNGPSLNCRPHSSRQRVDWAALARLKDLSPEDGLLRLLGDERQTKFTARAPLPPRRLMEAPESAEQQKINETDRATLAAWREQEALFAKLRTIAEDARTYEQDTGVHVLNVGFPLLSLPPGSVGSRQGGLTRRIIAPIAFIPVAITVKQGATRSIELRCAGEGTDRVTPNTALLAWLEQQTGHSPEEHFGDEEGSDPWREIRELVSYVAKVIDLDASATLAMLEPAPATPEVDAVEEAVGEKATVKEPQEKPAEPKPARPALKLRLKVAPRAEESDNGPMIIPSAILGLFPLANQGLLRDMQALCDGEPLAGPVEHFVKLSATLEATAPATEPAEIESRRRNFAEERLIAEADPCQARAVRLARECPTLVIHGPPGTGKSQTITNIIGDHLARGQRVLVVSDKRTALDVVANRLRHLGMENLFGVVHDPQRDQRELYRAIRQQLDDLPEVATHPQAARQLEQADSELQRLHGEVTQYATGLTTRDAHGYSFHDLVGEWFGITPAPGLAIDEPLLKETSLQTLDERTREIRDILERAQAVDLQSNPWRSCLGIELAAFLARPMAEIRQGMARCVSDAAAADAAADPAIPPFAFDVPLEVQAAARAVLAEELAKLLATADPAVLAHWAGRDETAISAAKDKLDAAAPQVTIFRSGKMDPELFERSKSPTALQTAADWKIVRDYAHGLAEWSRRLASVLATAPKARLITITQWLSLDEQSVERASKRLAQMRPLAEIISKAPLDRQMALQFSRQPIGPRQLIESTGLINDYLETASKWYAFLKPGVKKAAKPVAQYFGLPLDPTSASQMRSFLAALRARLDLKADLENGIVSAPLEALPADDELLSLLAEHRAVVEAVLNSAKPPELEMPVPAVDLEIIHSLMKPETEAARPILAAYGLAQNHPDAQRLATFLGQLDARWQLTELHYTHLAETKPGPLLDDAALEKSIFSHAAVFEFLLKAGAEPGLKGLAEHITAALRDPARGALLVDGLRKSPARAKAILTLIASLTAVKLFNAKWLLAVGAKQRAGEQATPGVTALADRLDDVESILRISVELAALPEALRTTVKGLVQQSAAVKEGLEILRKAILGGAILQRLAADANLQGVDGQRLKTSFERYRTLDQQKKEYVRRAIVHHWVTIQKSRLLAGTGSRLNGLGADLKRRLTLRGQRAMRLRQVISVGQQTDGGDPLFELCPVWMASPETVAQIFPRRALFDVVIFDEASQCRLEEALPVLTRAHRVVIAGDPRQLPPTRFFESAVAHSDDEEIETDQQLFESQQGEIEDLLGAALNLEIQECYLDVHYRSRNSDLIQFSNQNFYSSRLQAIPGHPANRTRYAPITLYRADGTYEKRCNEVEADRVCAIVKDLLKRADPPSIGIACFNLPQRDLIVEKLDALAEEEPDFARRLDGARRREGKGSFEGLFVKNLENVQGDERDHLIISTTYGPDAKGKFHRRFGPVGNVGGGRRLNVLVTRAREEVHLVTSIPATEYRSLPPIPPGQMPSGAYLLFAYLRYAEQLAALYEDAHQTEDQLPTAAIPPQVKVRATKTPSRFAEALAGKLAAEHGVGSDVHWGNDGFCIDVALHHPTRPDDVTVGVLCDTTRFTQAADPVEWDIFRTAILESQGWRLYRVWTPHFYRDTDGSVKTILNGAAEIADGSDEDEGLRVVQPQ